MILVDTSIWVDHLRAGDPTLAKLLHDSLVLSHPFVIGELALGNLRQREMVLTTLKELPRANVASDDEVLHFIGQRGLSGLGIGYVDVHLLAAARLSSGCALWTRDKRLHEVADGMGLAAAQI